MQDEIVTAQVYDICAKCMERHNLKLRCPEGTTQHLGTCEFCNTKDVGIVDIRDTVGK